MPQASIVNRHLSIHGERPSETARVLFLFIAWQKKYVSTSFSQTRFARRRKWHGGGEYLHDTQRNDRHAPRCGTTMIAKAAGLSSATNDSPNGRSLVQVTGGETCNTTLWMVSDDDNNKNSTSINNNRKRETVVVDKSGLCRCFICYRGRKDRRLVSHEDGCAHGFRVC
jgi:hypothetical protein